MQYAPANRFSAQNTAILCAFNSLLASMQEEFPVAGLGVSFLKSEAFSKLKGMFTNDDLCDMLGRRDYQCIDMVLPSIALFVNREPGYDGEQRLIEISTIFSELVGDLCSGKRLSGTNDNR